MLGGQGEPLQEVTWAKSLKHLLPGLLQKKVAMLCPTVLQIQTQVFAGKEGGVAPTPVGFTGTRN